MDPNAQHRGILWLLFQRGRWIFRSRRSDGPIYELACYGVGGEVYAIERVSGLVLERRA
jgi:hypothetical protein